MKSEGARGGFTLIELMIVVIIIAALAGMIVPNLIGRQEEALKEITKGDMKNIETVLKLYRLDNNAYPTTQQGLKALLKKPATATDWKGPYLDKLEDPWGNEYHYKNEASPNGAGIQIWSLGPDGLDGNEDDVRK